MDPPQLAGGCQRRAGLSYIASCLLSAGASDFRYTVWTIACSVLSVALLLSSWVPKRAAQSLASLAAFVRRLARRRAARSHALQHQRGMSSG